LAENNSAGGGVTFCFDLPLAVREKIVAGK